MANDIKLGDSHPLTEDIYPLKVNGAVSSLEISKTGSGCKVSGDLDITGTANVSGDVVSNGDVKLTGGKLYLDASDYIYHGGGGEVRMYINGTRSLTIWNGVLTGLRLEVPGDLYIDETNELHFGGVLSDTSIDEESADLLRFKVGGDEMLLLDEEGDKITMAATNWVAGTVSGATITEFSAANSAYAGMMLGCTHVFGAGVGGEYQAVTTAWESLLWDTDKYAKVAFVVPPSNKVEIRVFLPYNGLSGNFLYLGLATDTSATTLNNKYANKVWDVDESDIVAIDYSWVVDGSDHSWSAGESKTLYIMAYATGSTRLYAGGTNANYYGGVIVQAIALPATIGDGS